MINKKYVIEDPYDKVKSLTKDGVDNNYMARLQQALDAARKNLKIKL